MTIFELRMYLLYRIQSVTILLFVRIILSFILVVFILLPNAADAQSNATPTSVPISGKKFFSINQTEPNTANAKIFVPEPTIAEQRLKQNAQSVAQYKHNINNTNINTQSILSQSGVVLNKRNDNDENNTQLIIPLIVEAKAYQNKNHKAQIQNNKAFISINAANNTLKNQNIDNSHENNSIHISNNSGSTEQNDLSIDKIIQQNTAKQPPKIVEVSLKQYNNNNNINHSKNNLNIDNTNNAEELKNNEAAIQNIISMQSSAMQNKNIWYKPENTLDFNVDKSLNAKYNTNDITNISNNIDSKIIPQLLENAKKLLGVPYRYGGNTPSDGMDCSGFVRYVFYHSAGVNLPRTTKEISRYGKIVDKQNLKAGDLVFFNTRGSLSHLGIYLGDNSFIHAPSRGARIRIERLNNNYWHDKYDSAKRLIAEN